MDKPRDKHRCSVCKDELSTLSSLRRHNKKYHPDNVVPLRYNRNPSQCSYHCSKCEKSFHWKYTLQRHMKSHHNEGNASSTANLKENATVTATTRDSKESQCSFHCSKCEKSFRWKHTLRSHLKNHHNEGNTPSTANLKENATVTAITRDSKESQCSFQCSKCEKSFCWRHTLRRHLKNHHNEGNTPSTSNMKESATVTVITRNSKKCPLCSQSYSSKSNILAHFTDIHEVSIGCKQYTFPSFEAFNQWKSQMESETNSRFIIRKTSISKGHTCMNYICHRSGNYLPEGKGRRRLKAQGSNKINAYCPANIKITIEKDDGVIAEFLETHVGHEAQVDHLHLTTLERRNIAAKIASTKSFDEVLDQVRSSTTDNTLKRIHLLTRKDLFNIKASFNLPSSFIRHPNDAVSIDSWVTEMQRVGDCVLFYKRQGSLMDSHPVLKEQDFVLIIMTPAQSASLNKYGSDCICVDGTHEINNYDFKLTTLLVIDNSREGFPCAFMVSNRSDKDIMSVFFSQIRTRTGKLKPKTFMSDLADSYFNAWTEVMFVPQERFFCTWLTDRAWRKNLIKIASKEKQVILYKELRAILEERDVTAFQIMLEKFCSRVSDSETSDFIKYFKDNYQKNYKCWAYCCRLNEGINTNMHLERVHKTIKFIYLKGKSVKRLDKGIEALMRFVREKLTDQLVTSKGKISNKLKSIHAQHKNMMKLDDPSLIIATKNGWEVPSNSRNECYSRRYFIQEINKSCTCQLTCVDCNICIHRYCCTCMDSSINLNICKHIHLLAQFRKNSENLTDERSTVDDGDGEGTSEMPNDLLHTSYNTDDESEDSEEILLPQLSKKRKTRQDMSLEGRKRKNLIIIQKHLKRIGTESEIEAFEKIVAHYSSTLASEKLVSNKITITERSCLIIKEEDEKPNVYEPTTDPLYYDVPKLIYY